MTAETLPHEPRPHAIVILQPLPSEIDAAVHYAIKSGMHTYDRMHKGAWLRLARIARGRVNEDMIRRYATEVGIKSAIQDKSHRQSDAFDFTFDVADRTVEADVKTFHILNQFVRAPRSAFSIKSLLGGEDDSSPHWDRFFPMLIPSDYKRHKDVYIFAVSVEEVPAPTLSPKLDFPWSAFPDQRDEDFLVSQAAITAREAAGADLLVRLSWAGILPGGGRAVYERAGEAWEKEFPIGDSSELLIERLSSFLAVRLNDEAHKQLDRSRKAIHLSVKDGQKPLFHSDFFASRFREIFPRQDYALHLIGWIGREAFAQIAKTLPVGAPCYFYPPRQNSTDTHQPGTKTDNRYVLPGALNPISTLKEA